MHLGKTKVEIGNYQGREVGLGGGRLSQCVCVHRKTFGAPEGFVGFCGTRGSNMRLGQDREKNFWGPGKFCRLLWDQGFEYVTRTGSWKNFWGPGKFCRFLCDQRFEYVTRTGSQKKTFGAPKSFVGFCGTRGSNI